MQIAAIHFHLSSYQKITAPRNPQVQGRIDEGPAETQTRPAGNQKPDGTIRDRLVCVRYRYDEKTHKRCTTVELIVAEKTWRPNSLKFDTIVRVKAAYDETDLREKLRKAERFVVEKLS